jgi:hypothetical protein
MSLYGEYLTERTDDTIIETVSGFATYRYINDGKSVYIIDIFVVKEQRQNFHATFLADQIVAEAKSKGCTELIGTVMPSSKNSTTSLKVLLGYGMQLHSASENCIVFRKDI